jgi:hypothetical protein
LTRGEAGEAREEKTHGDRGFRHEAVVEHDADGPGEQAILACVLDVTLQIHAWVDARGADVGDLGLEGQHRDGNLVHGSVARNSSGSLDCVGDGEGRLCDDGRGRRHGVWHGDVLKVFTFELQAAARLENTRGGGGAEQ